MGKRNWFWNGWRRQPRARRQAKPSRAVIGKTRFLLLESLEPRQLLSAGPPLDPILASLLVKMTPVPHPDGDRPSDTGQMITLTAYTAAPIFDPGIPAFEPFVQGEQQIFSNILSNPAARPAYWGEPTASGGSQYRLYLCDNGMLVNQWTINWGDGSAPQEVSNTPWVVHPYAGNTSQYAITVTASSLDGTFTGGMGTAPGELDQAFNVASGRTTNAASRGPSPQWATQLGDLGQQTTNFEGDDGFDQATAETLDNGNILLVGTTANGQFGLVRYLEPGSENNGELDTSFGNGGLVTTTFAAGTAVASAVAVDQSNSTIMVACVVNTSTGNELVLAHYHDGDGSLDTSFGPSNDGTVTTDLGSGWQSITTVAVESNGNVLVAGSSGDHFALLHVNSDGTQDMGFSGNSDGVAVADFGGTGETPYAITLDSSGNIFVAGTSTQPTTGKDFALARFNADGTLYSNFGNGGLVTTDFAGYDDVATAIAIQANGEILLAGTSDQGGGYDTFALARYNTDGSLDGNFGENYDGLVTTDFGDGSDHATGVTLQSDGKIVVSGTTLLDGSGNIDSVTHFALARYNTDGSPDTNFGSTGSGTVTMDFSTLGFTTESASGIMLDANGRLIVAGTATQSTYSSFAVCCYDPGTSTLGVQINDVAPGLRVVGSQETSAGQVLDLSNMGVFMHAPVTAGNFSYQIDWGDGSAPDTGTTGTTGSAATIVDQGSATTPLVGTLSDQHTYATAGNYYIAATVTDPDGRSDTQTIQVTVNSPPVFLTTSIPDGTVNAGQLYTLPSVTFADASLLDTHTATIDWGDGTTDNPNLTEPQFDNSQRTLVPGSVTDSHVYSASGDYTGTITLTNEHGTAATENFTIHVLPAAIAVTSISCLDPSHLDANSVQYTVTFSQPVTGVDAADFWLAISGTVSGMISSVSANEAVNGYASIYTVTIGGVFGNGTLGLDLADDNRIEDASGDLLGGQGPVNGTFTGEVYTLDTYLYWAGSNTWDTTSAEWQVLNGPLQAWVPNSDAIFPDSSSGTITISGSVVANSLTFQADGYTLQGDSLALPSAGTTVCVAHAGDSATIGCQLIDPTAGIGSLEKTGDGTLVLTEAETFSGPTTILGGTLQLGDGTSNDGSLAGNIVNDSTLVFAGPYETNGDTYSGVISGMGTVTKEGTGILILAGVNSYNGNTIIDTGTLQIGADDALPYGANAGNVSIGSAGTLDLAGYTISINGLEGGGFVDNMTTGDGMLIVGNNSVSDAFSGTIQNSVGTLSLTKVGAGTQALSGTNTFAGTTTLAAGTLDVTGSVTGNLTNSSIVLQLSGSLSDNGATYVYGKDLGGYSGQRLGPVWSRCTLASACRIPGDWTPSRRAAPTSSPAP